MIGVLLLVLEVDVVELAVLLVLLELLSGILPAARAGITWQGYTEGTVQ